MLHLSLFYEPYNVLQKLGPACIQSYGWDVVHKYMNIYIETEFEDVCFNDDIRI